MSEQTDTPITDAIVSGPMPDEVDIYTAVYKLLDQCKKFERELAALQQQAAQKDAEIEGLRGELKAYERLRLEFTFLIEQLRESQAREVALRAALEDAMPYLLSSSADSQILDQCKAALPSTRKEMGNETNRHNS